MDGEHGISRRDLLVGASLGAAGLAAASLLAPCSQAQADAVADPAPSGGGQYGFLVRANSCLACGDCVDSCRTRSNTPTDAPARRQIVGFEIDGRKTKHISLSCMHCADPACAKVCPAHAITKGEGGIVSVDKGRCIGCKYCYQACPYGVPHYLADGMDKCDYCLGNGVKLGETPYCVRACKYGALEYGLVEELSELAGGAAVAVEGPSETAVLITGTRKA